jgi:adenosylhomocysteine nucleosidase
VIVVIAALEAEVRALRKLPQHFAASVSGMGAERAYRSAQRAIDGGAYALVSWGCAAALDSKLAPGTLLVPQTVLAHDGTRYGADGEWQRAFVAALRAPSVHTGALAHAPGVLTRVADKRALAARARAAAADMESAGVAKAAHEAGIPFLCARAVADGAELTVPRKLAQTVNADGSLDVLSGVARLALSPWHWPAAVRLGLAFNTALLALRSAAPALYAFAPAEGAGTVMNIVAREPAEASVIRA